MTACKDTKTVDIAEYPYNYTVVLLHIMILRVHKNDVDLDCDSLQTRNVYKYR